VVGRGDRAFLDPQRVGRAELGVGNGFAVHTADRASRFTTDAT